MTPGFAHDDGFPLVECPDRAAWRTWLEHHHESTPGAWLVFLKKHTGRASVGYLDSVLEALCFGWIDGLKRRVDEQNARRRDPEPMLTPELEQALRAYPGSWRNFNALTPGYRKQYVLWLTTAQRADTRERRLQEAIRLLAEGRKLGMR